MFKFKIVHMTVEEFLRLTFYNFDYTILKDYLYTDKWLITHNHLAFFNEYDKNKNLVSIFKVIAHIKNPENYILEYRILVLNDYDDYEIIDNEIVKKNYKTQECQRSVLSNF